MLSSLSDALHILVYLHISSYYILLQITLFLPSITKQYYYFEVCFCYVMFVCQQTVISISVLSVVLYCYMQSQADIGFLRLILFGHLKNCLPGSAVPNTSFQQGSCRVPSGGQTLQHQYSHTVEGCFSCLLLVYFSFFSCYKCQTANNGQ